MKGLVFGAFFPHPQIDVTLIEGYASKIKFNQEQCDEGVRGLGGRNKYKTINFRRRKKGEVEGEQCEK